MEEVVVRMRRVSEDLRVIRDRLEELRAGDEKQQRVLDEVLELDLIREFKCSVDQIRLFLWEYFQSAAARSGPEVDQQLREFRLRRATEMLCSMQDHVNIPYDPETEIKSLFERLRIIADVAVERHFSRKDDYGT